MSIYVYIGVHTFAAVCGTMCASAYSRIRGELVIEYFDKRTEHVDNANILYEALKLVI